MNIKLLKIELKLLFNKNISNILLIFVIGLNNNIGFLGDIKKSAGKNVPPKNISAISRGMNIICNVLSVRKTPSIKQYRQLTSIAWIKELNKSFTIFMSIPQINL